MALETRGPYHPGSVWYVHADGHALPGHVELLDGRYRVHAGGMRGLPWPPFHSLEAAARALADFHATHPPT
jgi:hypothetical protein